MSITTVSSREFNQDTGRAKKAANDGPVFITDRGVPAHVLLSIEDYRRLADSQGGVRGSIIDELGSPVGVGDVVLDLPSFREPVRAADFD